MILEKCRIVVTTTLALLLFYNLVTTCHLYKQDECLAIAGTENVYVRMHYAYLRDHACNLYTVDYYIPNSGVVRLLCNHIIIQLAILLLLSFLIKITRRFKFTCISAILQFLLVLQIAITVSILYAHTQRTGYANAHVLTIVILYILTGFAILKFSILCALLEFRSLISIILAGTLETSHLFAVSVVKTSVTSGCKRSDTKPIDLSNFMNQVTKSTSSKLLQIIIFATLLPQAEGIDFESIMNLADDIEIIIQDVEYLYRLYGMYCRYQKLFWTCAHLLSFTLLTIITIKRIQWATIITQKRQLLSYVSYIILMFFNPACWFQTLCTFLDPNIRRTKAFAIFSVLMRPLDTEPYEIIANSLLNKIPTPSSVGHHKAKEAKTNPIIRLIISTIWLSIIPIYLVPLAILPTLLGTPGVFDFSVLNLLRCDRRVFKDFILITITGRRFITYYHMLGCDCKNKQLHNGQMQAHNGKPLFITPNGSHEFYFSCGSHKTMPQAANIRFGCQIIYKVNASDNLIMHEENLHQIPSFIRLMSKRFKAILTHDAPEFNIIATVLGALVLVMRLIKQNLIFFSLVVFFSTLTTVRADPTDAIPYLCFFLPTGACQIINRFFNGLFEANDITSMFNEFITDEPIKGPNSKVDGATIIHDSTYGPKNSATGFESADKPQIPLVDQQPPVIKDHTFYFQYYQSEMLAIVCLTAVLTLVFWQFVRSFSVSWETTIISTGLTISGFYVPWYWSYAFLIVYLVFTFMVLGYTSRPMIDLVRATLIMTTTRVGANLLWTHSFALLAMLWYSPDTVVIYCMGTLCFAIAFLLTACDLMCSKYISQILVVERDMSTDRITNKYIKTSLLGYLMFGNTVMIKRTALAPIRSKLKSDTSFQERYATSSGGTDRNYDMFIRSMFEGAKQTGNLESCLDEINDGNVSECVKYANASNFSTLKMAAVGSLNCNGLPVSNATQIKLGNKTYIVCNTHAIMYEDDDKSCGLKTQLTYTNLYNVDVPVSVVAYDIYSDVALCKPETRLIATPVEVGNLIPGHTYKWVGVVVPLTLPQSHFCEIVRPGAYGVTISNKPSCFGHSGSILFNDDNKACGMKWGSLSNGTDMLPINYFVNLGGLTEFDKCFNSQIIASTSLLNMTKDDIENVKNNFISSDIPATREAIKLKLKEGKSIAAAINAFNSNELFNQQLEQFELVANEEYQRFMQELNDFKASREELRESLKKYKEDEDLMEYRKWLKDMCKRIDALIESQQSEDEREAIQRVLQLNARIGEIKRKIKNLDGPKKEQKISLKELNKKMEKLRAKIVKTRMPDALKQCIFPYSYFFEKEWHTWLSADEEIVSPIHPTQNENILSRAAEFGLTQKLLKRALLNSTTTVQWHKLRRAEVSPTGLLNWIYKWQGTNSYAVTCPNCSWSIQCYEDHECTGKCYRNMFGLLRRHLQNCEANVITDDKVIYDSVIYNREQPNFISICGMVCPCNGCIVPDFKIKDAISANPKFKINQWIKFRLEGSNEVAWIKKTCFDNLTSMAAASHPAIPCASGETPSSKSDLEVPCNKSDLEKSYSDRLERIITEQRMQLDRYQDLIDRVDHLADTVVHKSEYNKLEKKMFQMNDGVLNSISDLSEQIRLLSDKTPEHGQQMSNIEFQTRLSQQLDSMIEQTQASVGRQNNELLKCVETKLAKFTSGDTSDTALKLDTVLSKLTIQTNTIQNVTSDLTKLQTYVERVSKNVVAMQDDMTGMKQAIDNFHERLTVLEESPSNCTPMSNEQIPEEYIEPTARSYMFIPNRTQDHPKLHDHVLGVICTCPKCVCHPKCDCNFCARDNCIWCNSNTHSTSDCKTANSGTCPVCKKYIFLSNLKSPAKTVCCMVSNDPCMLCKGKHHTLTCPVMVRNSIIKPIEVKDDRQMTMKCKRNLTIQNPDSDHPFLGRGQGSQALKS
uniref:Uncharacterized protein n=1 Tax=Western African lungfish astro-like virus TaxID=2116421 RepID=A0A2P1GMB2_9VIRU|nr:hypothetical protein [Western African lungfish astro-like virus]